MAFERSRFERRGGDEDLVRESAPDTGMPEESRPDAPAAGERASAPDARVEIRTPETLVTSAPRERIEPTAEEALASRLAEARATYARAWLHEDILPQEEKDRVTREYLGAVSAMRAYHQKNFESDPSWTAAERAQNMEQLILSFTAEEKTRLITARDQANIEKRDAAAAASHGRYIAEDYREAVRIFSRGTRNVAEWYRSIPPRYRFAIGAGLFAATAGGAYLGLPILVAAGGGARLATRMLGGSSAALGAEGGIAWLQSRKSQREIFGAKQESTWNPNLRFSWNPLQMAAGLFRREASAEQTQKWASHLEAIIKNDDDTRLNDAIIGQAGRAGREKMTRALVAGAIFTAIAAGMPGQGFRFAGEQTGAADMIRAKAKAWTRDLLQGGAAEAAPNQEAGAATPQRETLYAKIRRGFGIGKPTDAPDSALPPGESRATKPQSIPKTEVSPQTASGSLTSERQNAIQMRLNQINHDLPDLEKRFQALDRSTTEASALLHYMEGLKKELREIERELRPAPAPTATEPAAKSGESEPPAPEKYIGGKKVSEIIKTDITDQKAWENIIKNDLVLEKQALIERARTHYLFNNAHSPETAEQWAQKNWQTEARAILEEHDRGESDPWRKALHRSEELRLPSDPSKITINHKTIITRGISEHKARMKFLSETPFDSTATRAANIEIDEHKKIIGELETKLKPTPPAPTPAPKAAPASEKGAPVAPARAALSPEAGKLATIRKGEGAWQAVRRQMYARMYDDIQKNPKTYNMTPEEVAKLTHDFEHPPKTGKVAKILNRETLDVLKKTGFINEDGTTKIGMRENAQVILSPNNEIVVPDAAKAEYDFEKYHKSRAGHPVDETQSGRGRSRSGLSTYDAATNRALPEQYPTRQSFDLNKESPLLEPKARLENTGLDDDLAAAEAIAAKTEAANLRTAHLTPAQYRPIARMKGEVFIKELGRHAAEINEYRAHGGRKPDIFINKGALTARGFRVDVSQAEKYLDLSERLEKHLKKMSWTPRQRLLKQPVGELLRVIDLKK